MTSEPPAQTVKSGDIARVMALLPHRYPFLMVDRMVEMVLGERAVGLKNVSVNEPHFQGHFPGEPIMPGVLLIEAMAQTAGALVVETLGEAMHGKLVYFMSIEDARFRHPVRPGDQIFIHVEKIHARRLVWKFRGECRVGDRVVADATYTAMIVDR
ncbi:MAG: 3-hydroxyacyl-ACP dehydratase FabZ [Candidatus Odyssella sp.]|nr:3-hydroxyacyl-ACP dehydratase FabZ [Candidatus Odyssella sp.]